MGDPAPHGGALPTGGRDLPGRRRPLKEEAAEASGYEVLAGVGVRVRIVVERLAARLRALARAAPFELELELLRLTGLGQRS